MRIRKDGHWLRKLAIISACMVFPLSDVLALPVVPGASGFGVDTPAGRGGAVYRVTNLNASGTGSLKACIDASGPRVCVFEVSGTIRLDRDMTIENPYITIAGQTAPSPGITLGGASLWVKTSHVLIQHLRFRVGDVGVSNPDNQNALYISSGGGGNPTPTNVVIANNSMSWAIDQLTNVYGDNVTFYRNFFTEALHDSLHYKGRHSMGPLLQIPGAGGKTRISMIGNLFAHNNGRNPLSRVEDLVFVNNVVYNWGSRGTELHGGEGSATRNSVVGNYYKAGVNSASGNAIILQGSGIARDMTQGSKVYVKDNITPSYDGSDPWSAVTMGSLDSSYRASSPPTWNSGLKAISSSDAYEWVLQGAGARPADRDAVDERVVSEVRNRNGRIINSQKDVGGWPTAAQNRRVLNLPTNPSGDSNGNGYTNLEEWLHQMAASVETTGVSGGVAPPSAPNGLTAQ